MSSGPKRIPCRTNIRTQARNKHGGARPGSGRKKKTNVRQDMRVKLLERMEVRAKKKKQHRMDVWVDILYDKQFRLTNAGGKIVLQMFKVVFLGSQTPAPWGTPKPPPAGEGDDDSPDVGGPPELPPMKPDPAKATAMNNVTDDN